MTVEHMPSHIALNRFPYEADALKQYGAVILSDIGSNTLLLSEQTTVRCQEVPNRLQVIRDYVNAGGGFAMMGGYLSFQGIDAKARYKGTAIEEILPVTLFEADDRYEAPEGTAVDIKIPDHPILQGIPQNWPRFLGFNKLTPKAGSAVLATSAGFPFMTAGEFGQGRTFAFATDIAPHWAPPSFLEWEHYNRFMSNVVRWLGRS
jgi:uncharacterized membrane protein